MTPRRIVQGQRVDATKAERARQLRRAMTVAERMLWDALRAHSLDGLHFRRQQVIDGFIADFYCSTAALIIEVDGLIHVAQPDYDRERDRILAGRGLRILRLSNDDVLHTLPTTLERISTACRAPITPPASIPPSLKPAPIPFNHPSAPTLSPITPIEHPSSPSLSPVKGRDGEAREGFPPHA
ncbi:MAG: endonuclease domain-containing protein [Chloroflexota bacterium]